MYDEALFIWEVKQGYVDNLNAFLMNVHNCKTRKEDYSKPIKPKGWKPKKKKSINIRTYKTLTKDAHRMGLRQLEEDEN